ncbi:MAG: hypothetical protein WD712_00380 [Candidatus Spechtbacterales bacterium]
MNPGLTAEEINRIEDAVDKMGYSSLVVPLGGLSTYPTMVSPGSNHKWVITTIAHEWVHIYITFTPLRWAEQSGSRQAMEETTANIVGKEIANDVWEEYYQPYQPPALSRQQPARSFSGPVYAAPRFDFNSAMQDIRKNVEAMLADGRIDDAEAYMRERRDWLEANGHDLRKLNQAYFVFYGYYADSPAHRDANGGVGAKMLELRALSPSLKEFLGYVSNMKGPDDLDKVLESLKSK